MFVIEALERSKRTSLTSVTVGTHESLSADAVALVLASAQLSGTFCTDFVAAGVDFPSVATRVGVDVSPAVANEVAMARKRGRDVRVDN